MKRNLATLCVLALVASTGFGQITLTIDQPQGPGSVRIMNTGGPAGAMAFTALTPDPANSGAGFGTGPWYGLHIDYSDLVQQAQVSVPWVDTFSATGETQFTLATGTVLAPLPELYGVTTAWSTNPLTFLGASAPVGGLFQAGPPSDLDYAVHVLPFSGGNRHAVVRDVNQDGFPDILCSSAIWLGDGNFGFTAVAIDPPGVEAEVADVDLDGFQDLIVLDEVFGFLKIYPGDGTGAFSQAPQQLPFFTTDVGDVRVADIDADGDPDLLCSAGTTTAPGVLRFTNDGTGSFSFFGATFGSGSTACEAVDLNGDNRPELVLDIIPFQGGLNAEYTSILWGNGSAIHELWNSNQLLAMPEDATRWVRAHDFDQDGLQDLLWAGTSNAGVLINQGGLYPTFSYRPFATAPESCCPLPRLAAADVDSDGDLDGVMLKTVYGTRYLVVAANDGAADFSDTWYIPGPASDAGFVITADIDQDGDDDIVVGGSPMIIYENKE